MPAGLQVYNNDGVIQIDENYRNMLLIKSGTFTANNDSAASDSWYQNNINTWRNCTQYAIMAVRCPDPYKLVTNPGSYRNGYKIPSFLYPQNGSSTFQYYIFDLVKPNSDHTYGLQVFDANGDLIFSALDSPMKVIATVSVPFVDESLGNRTNYVGPHSNCAYACAGGGFGYNDDGVGENVTNVVRTWFSGRSLMSQGVSYYNTSTAPGNYGESNQFGFIVDVTNVPKNYTRYP